MKLDEIKSSAVRKAITDQIAADDLARFRKAVLTDIQLVHQEYLREGSVHRVGVSPGVSGETVRQWLKDAGLRLNSSKWTENELTFVRVAYAGESVNTAAISQKLSRTYAAIALKASRMGLGNFNRPKSPEAVKTNSECQKERFARMSSEEKKAFIARLSVNGNGFEGKEHTAEFRKIATDRSRLWLANNPHPKGMLGKKHTPEVCQTLSKLKKDKYLPREQVELMLKTKLARYGTLAPPRSGLTWKSGWRVISDQRIYARSRWEANYARYLEWLVARKEIASWEHEPITFWFEGIKRGTVSYLPDFRVTSMDGSIVYHEVKGWMDPRSRTKLDRMARYHPTVTVIIIDKRWFKANRILAAILPGWEKDGCGMTPSLEFLE